METNIQTIYDFIINSEIIKDSFSYMIRCDIIFKVNGDKFDNKISIIGTTNFFKDINDENELNYFFFNNFIETVKKPEFEEIYNIKKNFNKDN